MPEIRKELLPVEIADRTKSKITLFTNGSERTAPVVLCMPAMGVPAEYYEPLALEGVAQGWHMATADLRGIGQSSVRVSRGTQFGYHEMVDRDWPAYVSSIRDRFPTDPLFLLGHSLGGQLSALYVAANPDNIQGLVLTAACSVWYRGWDFPKSLGILASTQLIRVIAEIVGYFPGNLLRFAGKESKKVIRDWARQARTGRYDVADSPHDFESLLALTRVPVLAISFEGDSLAPQRAVLNLCDKMPQAPITQWHVRPEDLGAEGINHFTWVKNAGRIVERISHWIDDIVSLPNP